MATEHDLCKNMRDINTYKDFDMLKVKVLIVFLGTVRFSLCRDGRYRNTLVHEFRPVLYLLHSMAESRTNLPVSSGSAECA